MRVAIVGTGQLARMLALAGMEMGIRCSFLAEPGEDTSCVDGLGTVIHRLDEWGPEQTLAALGHPEVVTIERESVDVELLRELAQHRPVYPNPDAVATMQHRLLEKNLVAELGLDTAPYRGANNAAEVTAAIEQLGLPVVTKSCRDGYDGRGQQHLRDEAELARFSEELDSGEWLVESRIDFEREVSLIGVRSGNGTMAFYPLTENQHHEGVLVTSMAPAGDIAPDMAQRAIDYLAAIMSELDYVGVIAMECFVAGERLLINELAPRVHNSGHWTLRSEASSQFENHLRAILGMPLGQTQVSGCAGIVNILGDYDLTATLRTLPAQATLMDYNKSAAPRRKLGHVNITGNDPGELSHDLKRVREHLYPAL